jgi:AAA domain
VFSGESGEGTLQETARRVRRSKQILLQDCDVRWCFRLPQLSRDEDLRALEAYLRWEAIEVVIIDPLYLCLIRAGVNLSTAYLFDVGPLLLAITRACLNAGATPLLIHHTRKQGTQQREGRSGPLDLNDLAFSGFAEFARQWVLLNRREPYEHDSGSHKLYRVQALDAPGGPVPAARFQHPRLAWVGQNERAIVARRFRIVVPR